MRPPPYPSKAHSTGQARIRLNGRDVYLGVWGSAESYAEYQRRIDQWRKGVSTAYTPAASGTLRTISDLVAAFLAQAKTDGRDQREIKHFTYAVRPLLDVCSKQHAEALIDFGPRLLKKVQAEMVRLGWSPAHANRSMVRIRTIWRWAESEEHVPGGTWEGLRTVRGLPCGKREGRPVPEDDLAATLPHLHPAVKAIAETQLWTGARPSEALGLRRGDLLQVPRVELQPGVWLKTGGKVWVVVLAQHKKAHLGAGRVLLFGPRAQAALGKLLDKPADAYLFSPRDVVHRKQLARQQHRPIGECWKLGSYDHAVARACAEAGVNSWTPYRLRHSAGTRLAAEFGPEVARIVLGHSDLDTTRRYVLDDLQKAVDVMKEAG